MERSTPVVLLAVAILALASAAEAKKCKKDAVQVGDACVDRYEASVWETSDRGTIKKLQNGKISNASQLTGKATQRGAAADDYGSACPDDASGCTGVFAASVPGVLPSAYLTWFQAAAACRNSGKRLPTNQEWQLAALGAPDPTGGDPHTLCHTDAPSSSVPTGSRTECISDAGAYDTVGNVWEWVADWVPRSTAVADWNGLSDDEMSLAGADTAAGPGALLRGGAFGWFRQAGPLAVAGTFAASGSGQIQGFRCARAL